MFKFEFKFYIQAHNEIFMKLFVRELRLSLHLKKTQICCCSDKIN